MEDYCLFLGCLEKGLPWLTVVESGNVCPVDHIHGREKLKLAADTNPEDHKIKIGGWVKDKEIDLFDHIENFFNRGLKYLKCSDITRDGVMDWPNFDLYKSILNEFPEICLVVSRGERNVDDFRKLRDMGLNGVVFGSAFYVKKIYIKT